MHAKRAAARQVAKPHPHRDGNMARRQQGTERLCIDSDSGCHRLMSAMATTVRAQVRNWRLTGMLMLLALIPAIAGISRLVELTLGATITAKNARFFATPFPVEMHILAVIPFAVLGALQLSPAWRKRHLRWHRAAGRVLVPLGLTTALTGLWMAHFQTWPEGDGPVLYALRLAAGTAMATAIILGIVAIHRKDFAAHAAWMTRAYAIAMGAGTQVLTHIPYVILMGTPAEGPRAALMGAGWLINAVLAEWVIRRTATKWPAAQAAQAAQAAIAPSAIRVRS